jgi:hypothetical protein
MLLRRCSSSSSTARRLRQCGEARKAGCRYMHTNMACLYFQAPNGRDFERFPLVYGTLRTSRTLTKPSSSIVSSLVVFITPLLYLNRRYSRQQSKPLAADHSSPSPPSPLRPQNPYPHFTQNSNKDKHLGFCLDDDTRRAKETTRSIMIILVAGKSSCKNGYGCSPVVSFERNTKHGFFAGRPVLWKEKEGSLCE